MRARGEYGHLTEKTDKRDETFNDGRGRNWVGFFVFFLQDGKESGKSE